MWKKIAIISISVVSISVGTAYAESALPTVHHVYIDDQHLGTMEDKSEVQIFLEEKVENAEAKYEDWDVSIKEEVTFEEQKVLSVKKEETKVLNGLDEETTLAVDVVRLHVNGKPIAQLPTEEKAEEVIDTVKEQYVAPDALEELEKEEKKPEIPADESEIVDVRLSETVSYKEDQVSLPSVNTVEEAVLRIEKGKTVSPSESKGKQVVMGLRQSADPLFDVIVSEQERKKEAIEHKVEVINTDKLYKGESEVKQAGKNGIKETLIEKTRRNDLEVEEEILEEEIVKEPVTKVIWKGTKELPSRGTGDFIWPAVGGEITSKQGERWGRYHKGIDIAGVSDKTIKASDNGKVVEAGFRGSFGNKVVIDHGNGYETVYAHLSSFDVKKGQVVRQGESLGKMGSTGRSTGTHLHFEIHKNDSLENPLSLVSH